MTNEQIGLIFSGLGLLSAAFVAVRFAVLLGRNSTATAHPVSKKAKISAWLIAGYFVFNCVMELTAWGLAEIPFPNHFIYGLNFLLVSFCLFGFFVLQSDDFKFGIMMLAVYVSFVLLFFRDSLWHPNSRLSFLFVMTYYSCQAVVSAVFLALSLIRHHRRPNSTNINFGILFFAYHFFALIISVFAIDIPAKKALLPYIYYINIGFNTLFYFIAVFVIFRIKKSSYHDC